MVFVLISFSEKNGLNPYRFKHYERYMYDYKETFRGEKATGRYEIVISISGEEYEVSISGKYREWEGVISNRFKNAEELAGFVLMKSYFDHYWLIPLTRTLFSKTLVKVLGSREVELSPGVKEIDKDTFRVVKECKFGGLEGVMMEVWHKKEVVFKLCLTPYTSLPTYVYKKTDEGNVYEIELLEYSDLK
ncbi:hypothetical protein [Hydrogenivirga caldilitoris]|nr:hypothetical protein [Hydrogenivirga caldilitoris]